MVFDGSGSGPVPRDGSIASQNSIGDRYKLTSMSKSSFGKEDTIVEDRNPSELDNDDSSVISATSAVVSLKSEDKLDNDDSSVISATSAVVSLKSEDELDNDDTSVISGTSAVVSLKKTFSKVSTVFNRASTPVTRTVSNKSSIATKNTGSKRAPTPITSRTVSDASSIATNNAAFGSQGVANLNVLSSGDSMDYEDSSVISGTSAVISLEKSSSKASTVSRNASIPVTRTVTGSSEIGMNRTGSVMSNGSSEIGMNRSTSVMSSASALLSKPSVTWGDVVTNPNIKANEKKSAQAKDVSTIEPCIKNRDRSTTSTSVMTNHRLPSKPTTSKLWNDKKVRSQFSTDLSTASSMDSQELYALRMAYGYSTKEEEKQYKKEMAEKEKAKKAAEKARKEREKAQRSRALKEIERAEKAREAREAAERAKATMVLRQAEEEAAELARAELEAAEMAEAEFEEFAEKARLEMENAEKEEFERENARQEEAKRFRETAERVRDKFETKDKEEQRKKAELKVANEKFAQERAEQERAAQEHAVRERTIQVKSAQQQDTKEKGLEERSILRKQSLQKGIKGGRLKTPPRKHNALPQKPKTPPSSSKKPMFRLPFADSTVASGTIDDGTYRTNDSYDTDGSYATKQTGYTGKTGITGKTGKTAGEDYTQYTGDYSDGSDYSDYSSESDDDDEDGTYMTGVTGDGETRYTRATAYTKGTENGTAYTRGTEGTAYTKDSAQSYHSEGGFQIITRNSDDETIKSNMSSMSGSQDEEEDPDANPIPAIIVEEEAVDPTKKKQPKKKKKVVMFSTGLGKAKTKTTVTEKKVSTKKVKKTTTNMKASTMRAPKSKVKKKKTASQMITIRQSGKYGVDDIVPVKSEKGAKIMRVCKLTSKGYISAEFTSVDPRNTPLHIACLTHYPEKFIVDHLIKGDKKNEPYEAVFTENSSGELPIHYAVMDRKGVPKGILDKLLEIFPESVEHGNIDGSLPIHVACEVGAPSLFVIKRLCEAWPESVMVQNDLEVPLDDDDDDEMDELDAPLSCCFEYFGVDWFGGGEDLSKYDRFETGWTPLHLASVNGAEPEVIEALLEAKIESLELKTNKGRTALECAKWCVINAILNDVSVCKLQNTFAAIQIMQSYDLELRVKEELIQKAGLVNAAVENSDSYGEWWRKTVEMMPKQEEDKEEIVKEGVRAGEVGLTDLHRAVLSRSSPEDVQVLLERSPECMDITSTYDRTPLECAKHIIIKGLLIGETISALTNTFVSLEIMQAFDEERDVNYELDATAVMSKSLAQKMKNKGDNKFGTSIDNYNYTKKFLEMKESNLGNFVKSDNDSAIQPHEYYPPENLTHVNLRVNIPVGFRRFRRAFLNYKHDFLDYTVLQEHLGYNEVNILPWSKHKKAIGVSKLKKGDKWEHFVGSIRTMQYLVPPSEAGGVHTAYETMELIDYNDFCFAVKSIIKTPDLPYGSEYELHHQLIVHDKGINNLRMICSSEVKFTGMHLEDKWEVRNSMRYRTTEYFRALSEAMLLHSNE